MNKSTNPKHHGDWISSLGSFWLRNGLWPNLLCQLRRWEPFCCHCNVINCSFHWLLMKSVCVLPILLKPEGNWFSQKIVLSLGSAGTFEGTVKFLCSWAARKYTSSQRNLCVPKTKNFSSGGLWMRKQLILSCVKLDFLSNWKGLSLSCWWLSS